PNAADIPATLPNHPQLTAATATLAHTCASSVTGTTCLTSIVLSDGLYRAGACPAGYEEPAKKSHVCCVAPFGRGHSKESVVAIQRPHRARRGLMSGLLDVGQNALELVEPVVANHDLAALRT